VTPSGGGGGPLLAGFFGGGEPPAVQEAGAREAGQTCGAVVDKLKSGRVMV
jgi:hypothetical protein